jgi:hypothetical protein
MQRFVIRVLWVTFAVALAASLMIVLGRYP